MGYFAQTISRASTKVLGDSGNDFGGALSMILGGGQMPNARSTEELLGVTASSTWPHLAATLKANSFAATKWNLLIPGPKGRGADRRANSEYRLHKKKLEAPVSHFDAVKDRASLIGDLKATGFLAEIQDHPFLRMLDQGTMWAPHPEFQLSGYETAKLMSTTIEAVGEYFVALSRDRNGTPVQMLPIPPHWVLRPFELLSADSTTLERQQRNYEIPRLGMFGDRGIPPRDMMLYKVANPRNPYRRGSGDMNAVDAEAAIDELASTHIAARFRNNGVPLLLMMLAGMTDPEKKNIEHEWDRDLMGPLRAGMTKFLKLPQAFDIKKNLMLHELQSSVVDMAVPELRNHERDLLLIGQRIPPLLAGEQSSGNRAMALVAFKLFELNSMTPAREGARSHYQSRLFEPVAGRPAEYQGGFIVMWSAPEVTDEGSRDRMMATVPEMFSRHEFKRVAGMQPRPGDDDIYLMPTNKVLYSRKTNEIIFAPPQPKKAFGASELDAMSAKLAEGLNRIHDLADEFEALAVAR